MLSKFEVQGFKSFGDSFVFDLSDTKSYEFNQSCVVDGVCTKAIIYGPNGCGKSNLMLALTELVSHLTDKKESARRYSNYLNKSKEREFAEFTYTFKFGENTAKYTYRKSSYELIDCEELYVNGVKVISHKRGEDISTTLGGTESLNKALGDSNISALKYIKSNAVLSETDPKAIVVKEFFEFVEGILMFRNLSDGPMFVGFDPEASNLIDDLIEFNRVGDFQEFLNNAGVNCTLEENELNGKNTIFFNFGDGRRLIFTECASTGTLSLLLFYFWFQRLKSGKVKLFMIDEFDAYYHNKLSRLIVSELRKYPAQVILTTHNVAIMSTDILRPDCYFILDDEKISPLHRRTEKELREAHNIEKMYRSGSFDG